MRRPRHPISVCIGGVAAVHNRAVLPVGKPWQYLTDAASPMQKLDNIERLLILGIGLVLGFIMAGVKAKVPDTSMYTYGAGENFYEIIEN